MPMSTLALADRVRRVAAWRPEGRRRSRAVAIRCPFCRVWRSPRRFRRLGGGCRKCVGLG